MYMVGPDVRSQQIPVAVRAMHLDGREYRGPARWNKLIGILQHGSAFCCDPLCIHLQQPCPRQIVLPVYRSGLVAMQARAVPSERNEVPQAPLPCGRGSAKRPTTLGFPGLACIPTTLS